MKENFVPSLKSRLVAARAPLTIGLDLPLTSQTSLVGVMSPALSPGPTWSGIVRKEPIQATPGPSALLLDDGGVLRKASR